MSQIALFLLIVLSMSNAWACRCIEPGPADAFRRADAVALLKIKKVGTPKEGIVHLEASVSQAWKAGLPASINILTEEACSVPFKEEGAFTLCIWRKVKPVSLVHQSVVGLFLRIRRRQNCDG